MVTVPTLEDVLKIIKGVVEENKERFFSYEEKWEHIAYIVKNDNEYELYIPDQFAFPGSLEVNEDPNPGTLIIFHIHQDTLPSDLDINFVGKFGIPYLLLMPHTLNSALWRDKKIMLLYRVDNTKTEEKCLGILDRWCYKSYLLGFLHLRFSVDYDLRKRKYLVRGVKIFYMPVKYAYSILERMRENKENAEKIMRNFLLNLVLNFYEGDKKWILI